MRALARTLGLSDAPGAHFPGYLASHDFGRLWKEAGALVFPSLHEGFGIPLLEAMEHDVPILCSRDGSLPEVGADACLFVNARRPEELAAGLTRLATDPALRRRLILAGRRRLLDFSMDREAGRLLQALVGLARAVPPYRPFTRGISPDGWTGQLALLALPGGLSGPPVPGRLTLRFHALPASRRVRLRAGAFVELGSFVLPPFRSDFEITTEFLPAGGSVAAGSSRRRQPRPDRCPRPRRPPARRPSASCRRPGIFPVSHPMRISVVIPSYNQADYLAATLESVCAQDHPDIEVLVFDGGSTDGSVDILRQWTGTAGGAPVRWVSQRDGGQADAINQGLRASTGDVLAYLNSDDVYYPGALAAVAGHFGSRPDCLALYGRAHHLNADGSIMDKYPTEPWNYDRLLETCFLCQPAVFWRREVMARFGLFDDALRYALDYDYWLRVGRHVPFEYLPDHYLAGSRLHGDTKTLSQRVPVHLETGLGGEETRVAPRAGAALDQASGPP